MALATLTTTCHKQMPSPVLYAANKMSIPLLNWCAGYTGLHLPMRKILRIGIDDDNIELIEWCYNRMPCPITRQQYFEKALARAYRKRSEDTIKWMIKKNVSIKRDELIRVLAATGSLAVLRQLKLTNFELYLVWTAVTDDRWCSASIREPVLWWCMQQRGKETFDKSILRMIVSDIDIFRKYEPIMVASMKIWAFDIAWEIGNLAVLKHVSSYNRIPSKGNQFYALFKTGNVEAIEWAMNTYNFTLSNDDTVAKVSCEWTPEAWQWAVDRGLTPTSSTFLNSVHAKNNALLRYFISNRLVSLGAKELCYALENRIDHHVILDMVAAGAPLTYKAIEAAACYGKNMLLQLLPHFNKTVTSIEGCTLADCFYTSSRQIPEGENPIRHRRIKPTRQTNTW